MVGPTLASWLPKWRYRWAPLFGLTSVAAAGLLAWLTPLVDPRSTPQPEVERGWGWLNANVAALFLATIAVTFTLSGTDLGMVAATRTMGAESLLAVAIVAWGFGSLLGALFYGSLRMSRIPVMTLTLGLAITTIPVALARDPWSLAALLFVTGPLRAQPVGHHEALSHAVPESRRGEAISGRVSPPWATRPHPDHRVHPRRVGLAAGFHLTGVVAWSPPSPAGRSSRPDAACAAPAASRTPPASAQRRKSLRSRKVTTAIPITDITTK